MTSRLFVPEVIQTSQMGCASAALTAMARGFGLWIDAARLAEELHTGVDGTSINALEGVANELGLRAEQRLVPSDHLFARSTRVLPAIVVVHAPNIGNHLVVVWRRVGQWLQVMDPERGRHWVSVASFTRRLLVHEQLISLEQCSALTRSDPYGAALAERAARLGISSRRFKSLWAHGLTEPGAAFAMRVDAALRLLSRVHAAGALRRPGSAATALQRILDRFATMPPERAYELVPAEFWAARAEGGGVRLRGSLVVTCRPGARPARAVGRVAAAGPAQPASRQIGPLASVLLPLLKQESPWRAGLLVVGGVASAALAVSLAIVLRALVELDRAFPQPAQRYVAALVFAAVLLGSLLLELSLALSAAGLARRLEARLRVALLTRLPRIIDRYFRTRTAAEMTERAHVVHLVRALIPLLLRGWHALCTIVCLLVGVWWLNPQLTRELAWLAVAAVGLPLLALPLLNERDLRLRTYQGQIARFYLESMQGLVPVRVHRAERTIRSEHEALLVELQDAHLAFQRLAIAADLVVAGVGLLLAAALLRAQLQTTTSGPASLLTLFWAVQVPALGQRLAHEVRAYPAIRNVVARLGELLRAPMAEPLADARAAEASPSKAGPPRGTAIDFENVGATHGGVPIVSELSLQIRPGEHVAVVGASGAGKSTLLGLLLGWLSPATGQLSIDGEPATAARLVQLHASTAWVDSDVRLWNQSLHENVLYGAANADGLSDALRHTELWPMLESRPTGLATIVGEEGRRLSGGEGQRVRLARAWSRTDASLVLLDEPFRGLSREQSQRLLRSSLRHWAHATVLCVTHDLEQIRDFQTVVVMDAGRIVEVGSPAALLADPRSRCSALLAMQLRARQLLPRNGFRTLTVGQGGVREEPMPPTTTLEGPRACN